MTDPDTISADYTLRPSELAATLALLVEARQPTLVWGPPGAAKSAIAQQVAADAGRQYVDVRALLLDPVDLRGIPWRDGADRTRWAPPAFLPPTDDPGRWLINLEELPSAVQMVQAALYQLVLDRKVGEYELPEGASLIACGNRESDRGVVHRMPPPLPPASRPLGSRAARRGPWRTGLPAPIVAVTLGRAGRLARQVAGMRTTTPALSSSGALARNRDASPTPQRRGWNISPPSTIAFSQPQDSAARCTGTRSDNSLSRFAAPEHSLSACPSGTCWAVACADSPVV